MLRADLTTSQPTACHCEKGLANVRLTLSRLVQSIDPARRAIVASEQRR